jgi:acetate kinase
MGPTASDPKRDPARKVRALHTEEDKQLARHWRALLQAGAG